MYHVHFGLEKRVFDDGIAQDAAVYLGARQQAVIADCSVALASSDAVVVITGRTGTGKTTLAGTALRTTSTRLALGALSGDAIGACDLLEWLLTEFGFARERGTRAERLQTWRQFLSEARTTDSRVFVVVERTENLGVEGLRTLAALTTADLNGCPGANLILLGEKTLLDVLDSSELEGLRQRIRLRHALEPLSAEEVALYVGHHEAAAGGEPMQLFPPETLEALHAFSDGIPRLVNNLAETAASLAATRRETCVAPVVVEEAARKFLGLTGRKSKDSVPAAAAPVLAAANEQPLDVVAAPIDVGEPADPGETIDVPPKDRDFPDATAGPRDAANASPDAPQATHAPPDAPPSEPSADNTDLPILTDAVELPEGTAAPEPLEEPELAAPRGDTSESFDDVESLPDMGAAMAETLFGDSDLDLLGAALASGGWDEIEDSTPPATLGDLDAADDEDAALFGAASREISRR
jgi:general secretion pathway protein A